MWLESGKKIMPVSFPCHKHAPWINLSDTKHWAGRP